ncbi:MAG: OsmC family protein [Xanthomonadales bacterium]|jgi:uncharacterized OsmC-like protein|nr:OsmC family protein [Xanthomonadales bacterium]
MQDYPHHYIVSADAACEGIIDVSSPGLETLPSLAPAEFGGPGDLWSPETFLVAAVADCFILTFRAIARASKFEWNSLSCEVDGVLDRVDKVTQFTDYHIKVVLHVPAGSNEKKAERLLHKSEQVCLVTNSLTGRRHLHSTIVLDD